MTQSGDASWNCTIISRPRAVPDMRPASRAMRLRLTSVVTGAPARSSKASRSAHASKSVASVPACAACAARSVDASPEAATASRSASSWAPNPLP